MLDVRMPREFGADLFPDSTQICGACYEETPGRSQLNPATVGLEQFDPELFGEAPQLS